MRSFFVNAPNRAQQARAAYLAANIYGSSVLGDNFSQKWSAVPIQNASSHIEALASGRGAGAGRIVFSSGGSTGAPKYTLLGISEVLENSAAHGLGYKSAGIRPDDIVATWGMPGLMNSEFTVYLALAQCDCAIVPIGDGANPERLLKLLTDFHATVLLVMPSDFVQLAGLLERQAVRLKNVRLVVTGGEPLFESDKTRFKRLLGSGSNVEFRSVFQGSDTGTIGYQCEHCLPGEYHLHADVQLAELVDIDANGAGELVVTNLQRTLMPVVRRKTGELVSVLHTACKCGSKAPRIRLLKRIGQVVKLGGEKFDTMYLSDIRKIWASR